MMLAAATTFMFRRAGMLSADGRCKALDKSGARGWASEHLYCELAGWYCAGWLEQAWAGILVCRCGPSPA